MIAVTWTGAAGLRFEDGADAILIDPYYTRVGILKTLFSPVQADEQAIEANLTQRAPLAAIIVGHTHSDHALDVPYLASRCSGQVVGSSSLETLMQLSGLAERATICKGGEKVELMEGAAVTMIPSAHGNVAMGRVPFPGEISPSSSLPMKASGYRAGTVFAPKLEWHGQVFLHIGSANFLERELDGHFCNVLFLCVAGWKKSKGYPERILEITRPEKVVLFHYDDFSKPHAPGKATRRLPLVDVQSLCARILEHTPQVSVIVPEIGETIEF